MGQEVILNGRTSNIAPDNALVINRPARFSPPILNGLMPTDVTINGLTHPPVLNGCVLNLPLYHSALSPSSFKSLDAYGHLCPVTGALWRPDGRDFDGTDDKITIPDHSALDITESITIELWMKVIAYEIAGIVGKGETLYTSCFRIIEGSADSVRQYMYIYDVDGGSYRWNTVGGHSALDTWFHLMFTSTYNGGTAGYVNGALNGSQDPVATRSKLLRTDNIDLILGTSPGSGYLKMIVGELRIYDGALSATTVLRIYNATKWRYQ